MKRHLYNLVTFFSLATSGALLAICAASWKWQFRANVRGTASTFYFDGGGASLFRAVTPGHDWTDWNLQIKSNSSTWGSILRANFFMYDDDGDMYRVDVLGFTFGELFVNAAGHPPRASHLYYAFPLWFPALLAAIPPTLWLRRHRRAALPNHCPTCNYDLRATPVRCPECGTAVATVATPTHH